LKSGFEKEDGKKDIPFRLLLLQPKKKKFAIDRLLCYFVN
jgi:hypothetical protein